MSNPAERTTLDAIKALPDAPRAPAFIVTIYGDVVEPRGGMLWIGTLIECCAQHGLNESLVRTAVSRLVTAGRLEGVRIGRKSFYRLSDAAREEFRDAAKLLFSPPQAPEDWLFCLSDELRDMEPPAPWAKMSPNVAITPNQEDVTSLPGVMWRAKQIDGFANFRTMAEDRWNLSAVSTAYRTFLNRHRPDKSQGSATASLTPSVALALRLRLVHDYRLAALSDPRLPASALPEDWPAEEARRLFVREYIELSERSGTQIASKFQCPDGFLQSATPASERRLFLLRREAAV